VVDAAYARSLALSTNLHPSGFDQLMDKTIASALVDKLLHRAHANRHRGRVGPPGPCSRREGWCRSPRSDGDRGRPWRSSRGRPRGDLVTVHGDFSRPSPGLLMSACGEICVAVDS